MGMNYDTYIGKHCARYYGWLPASKEFKNLIDKPSLKYLTLCACQAIDVFMLELEGVLQRDERKRLPNVIICEKDPGDAAEIFRVVRPPLQEAIIVAPLEDMLTFKDTDETKGLSPEAYVRDRSLRRLLRIKGLSQRIKQHFPFDIINFDTYGNLLNPAPERNRLYQAFERIFALQQGADEFLLFVTTPISDIHPDVESSLKVGLESNVSSYARVRRALESSAGTVRYQEIDEKKRIAVGFAKSLVIPAAQRTGWDHNHRGIFVYDAPSGRTMLSSVVEFTKASAGSTGPTYLDDIIRVIEHMPRYYSYEDSLQDNEVKDHLQKVKEYREGVRSEYTDRL